MPSLQDTARSTASSSVIKILYKIYIFLSQSQIYSFFFFFQFLKNITQAGENASTFVLDYFLQWINTQFMPHWIFTAAG